MVRQNLSVHPSSLNVGADREHISNVSPPLQFTSVENFAFQSYRADSSNLSVSSAGETDNS